MNSVRCFTSFVVPIGIVTALVGFAAPGRAQTLLHQYIFNGNVTDQVGTANGTLLNGATASGGFLSLDGVDDYVQFGSKIVPTSGSYSVTIFARQNALQGSFIALISQGFSSGPGFYIGHDPGNFIRASDSWANTGTAFATNTALHQYALTVDAASNLNSLYVDGILRNTLVGAITTTTSGNDTRFGRQFDPFAEFFNGQLQDVRVYSGALSASQVASLAAAGPVTSAAAPEPGSFALALFGGIGTAAQIMRRRRRSRAA